MSLTIILLAVFNNFAIRRPYLLRRPISLLVPKAENVATPLAEPIEMPFGIWTQVRTTNHVLGGGAHRRHLANTTEPPVCGGDATCCQITLTSVIGAVAATERQC